MTKIKYLLILLFALACGFTGYKITRSYFTDTEKVLGNSIQVGVWSVSTTTPTPTTSPASPTSTPTETPTPSPTETPIPTSPASPTPSPIANHLVINEVYYDVCSKDNCGGNKGSDGKNEWVEIYNPTSNSIDISGWKICDNTGCETVSSSSAIPTGGFAIITPQSDTWNYWSIPAGVVKISLGTSNIGSGLNNDSDRVILKDNNGNVVDQMSYGADTTAFNPACPNVPEGHSLERNPSGKDTDTAGDFVDRSSPTPGS